MNERKGERNLLVQNDYFDLFIKNDDVVIRPKKEGYPLKSFDMITRNHPRLKIASFSTLRTSLAGIGENHVIGHWLPLIEAIVSVDKMDVQFRVNATSEEIEGKKNEILIEARKKLDEIGVLYGQQELSLESFLQTSNVIGAIGKPPVKGEDAVVTYIERPDRKPVIREDGSANYFEMNFVFQVTEGDWLGEKIPAQDGEDGIDVFGNIIPALKGSDLTLHFDRKSVVEHDEEGKIVLRALHDGALEFIDDQVVVGKHLSVEGDVGAGTGSITFNGSVTVKGSVHAGYSIVATDNISIEGSEGVTNAKLIQSTEGGVYIKGGVFGGGITVVEAKKNIFVKHANNCKIYAEELHIGLYLFGSQAFADQVFLDKSRGKIIGGTVEALFTIECAIAGNDHERTTVLRVNGIDKTILNNEIREMAQDLKKHQKNVAQLEVHANLFEKNEVSLLQEQQEAYKKVLGAIESNKNEIIRIDKEIQLHFAKIKSAKECQIEVTNVAFPGTVIQIGKVLSNIRKKTNGVFKVVDGVLNV